MTISRTISENDSYCTRKPEKNSHRRLICTPAKEDPVQIGYQRWV